MKLTSVIAASVVAIGLMAPAVMAKTLRMADSADIAGLDPHSVTESNTIGFLHHVYEPLVRYNDELKVEPALATSWEVVEPTRVRFHLREGVAFHNGNPFTADDVVASITRAIDPDSPVKGNLPSMVGAEKVDDYTIDLLLNGPDPIIFNYLTNIYILDKEWMEENDTLLPADLRKGRDSYATAHANGTGPFIVESRKSGAKTVLVVNPDWWDTPQHNLTRIEFTPISSDATRISAILSGELDFITPAPLQDIDRVNNAEGVSVIVGPELRTMMLGINYHDTLNNSNITDANPLKDLRVRQALQLAIDLDLIQEKIMRGRSRISALLVAPEVPGYDKALDVHVAADPEAAKSLLAEAGYPDGFSVGFDCTNDRYVNDEEVCQAINAMWARIGVKANLATRSASKHFERRNAGLSDIYLMGWATLPMLDTYSVLSAMLHTPGDRMGGVNPGGYSNAKIDELTDKVAVEMDPEPRTAMMSEALKIARDDVALIPLYQQPLAWAVRDGVHLKVTADNKPRLWYATINN